MNTFVIEEFNVAVSNACNFYTVRFDDAEVSETDKFYDKFFVEENEYFEDMQIIHALILELSERGMSLIRRSRDESRAFALPPEALIDSSKLNIFERNNLRLYYVEVSKQVVILLGGGIAHNGPSGKPPIQLQDAQTFAKKIIEAFGTEFTVKENQILSLAGSEVIIN